MVLRHGSVKIGGVFKNRSGKLADCTVHEVKPPWQETVQKADVTATFSQDADDVFGLRYLF